MGEECDFQSTEGLQLRDSAESTNHFSMLHLNAAAAVSGGSNCGHHHCNSPCATACNSPCANGSSGGSNSLKRRSPASSSAAGSDDRSAKKLVCDQDDLVLRGFSSVSLPMSLGPVSANRPVLRRCVSDAYQLPSLDPVAVELPACFPGSSGGNPAMTTPHPAAKGAGKPPLPPLPRGLRRTVSSPAESLSRALSSEESNPDPSKALTVQKKKKQKRMSGRLKMMKHLWDEVLEDVLEEKEEQEEEVEEKAKEENEEQEKEEVGELDECAVAEEDKILPQDELGGGDSEEAISVEWAEKCLRLTFRCPCGKGYEVLLSENNCYYKLV